MNRLIICVTVLAVGSVVSLAPAATGKSKKMRIAGHSLISKADLAKRADGHHAIHKGHPHLRKLQSVHAEIKDGKVHRLHVRDHKGRAVRVVKTKSTRRRADLGPDASPGLLSAEESALVAGVPVEAGGGSDSQAQGVDGMVNFTFTIQFGAVKMTFTISFPMVSTTVDPTDPNVPDGGMDPVDDQ
jgi:hypothetical protein